MIRLSKTFSGKVPRKATKAKLPIKQQIEKQQAIAPYEFPDKDDDVSKRKYTSSFRGITVKNPYGYINPYYKDHQLYMKNPILATLGGISRLLHWESLVHLFTKTPYDGRKKNQEYMLTCLTGLIDSTFQNFKHLPEPVKSQIEDSFENVVNFHIIQNWILRKFLSNSKDLEIEKQDQHRYFTDSTGKIQHGNIRQHQPLDKDRDYLLYQLEQRSFWIIEEKLMILEDNRHQEEEKHEIFGKGVYNKGTYKNLYSLKNINYIMMMDFAFVKNDYEMAQVIQMLVWKKDQCIRPSTLKWFVDFVHINNEYFNLYTPNELLACYKNFKWIFPEIGSKENDFTVNSITKDQLAEEKLVISKPIHDILLLAHKEKLESS